MNTGIKIAIVFIIIFTIFIFYYEKRNKQKKQLNFIQKYKIPKPIMDRFKEKYPKLQSEELSLVNKALMDYFYLCNMANGKMVSMPSRVVDDLWHEFLLFSSVYESFCKKAFGHFLHHIPDEVMPNKKSNNEGMKRAWQLIAQKENINPKFPDKMPLLFAIDTILEIDNGIKYSLTKTFPYSNTGTKNDSSGCTGSAGCGGYYVGDYANSSHGGFGDSGSSSGGDSNSSCGGSSCGSGCGSGCGGS